MISRDQNQIKNIKKIPKSSKTTNLFERLQTLTDYRRKQGRKHHLAVILLINIMAVMAGYSGVIAKGDFIKIHEKELLKLFSKELVKHGLPAKNTLDRAMQVTNFDELAKVFTSGFDSKKSEILHLDGKAIAGTITDSRTNNQKFQMVVSVLIGDQVFTSKTYNNSKKSEIVIVQEIIETLGLSGKVLTLDALHCQKKL